MEKVIIFWNQEILNEDGGLYNFKTDVGIVMDEIKWIK